MRRFLYVAIIILSITGLAACSQAEKRSLMNNKNYSMSQTSSTETGVGISVLVSFVFIVIPKQINP